MFFCIFQNQIKKMQSETFKMKKMIDDLENEKNYLRDENIQLLSTIKSLKTEMKIQLAEKPFPSIIYNTILHKRICHEINPNFLNSSRFEQSLRTASSLSFIPALCSYFLLRIPSHPLEVI